MTLLHWILSASGLILVVLALRALLGRRISAAMRGGDGDPAGAAGPDGAGEHQ